MTDVLLGAVQGMRVLKPIPVQIIEENGWSIAWSEDLDVYGDGEDQTAALRDLQHIIVELHTFLNDESASYAPRLIRQRETLSTFVERRNDG